MAPASDRRANVRHYASIVRHAPLTRQMIGQVRRAIFTSSDDPSAIANGAGTRFAEAIRQTADEAHATGSEERALRYRAGVHSANAHFKRSRAFRTCSWNAGHRNEG